jgi:hypothetical protein
MRSPRFNPAGACLCAAVLLAGAPPAPGQAPPDIRLPGWVDDVGAARVPVGARVFEAGAFGAVGDGRTSDTSAIQAAINACGLAGGGLVTLRPGTYLTGALFLRNHVRLRIELRKDLNLFLLAS